MDNIPPTPTIEEILHQLNGFGTYQVLLILFIGIPCSFPSSVITYAHIFITEKMHTAEESQMQIFGLVILCAGNLCGLIIFGFWSDKIGRRITYFIMLAVLMIGNLITIFSLHPIVYGISGFLCGSTISSAYHIPFILCLEFTTAKYRSLVYLILNITDACGVIAISAIAYYIERSRFLIIIICFTLFSLYFLYWFCYPESFRWLLLQNKKEAIRTLEKIATINKTKLKAENREFLKNEIAKDIQRDMPNLVLNFKVPNMRLVYLIIFINWVILTFTYILINYLHAAFWTNIYINFIMTSSFEILCYIFVNVTVNIFGRRKIIFTTSLITSTISFVLVAMPQEQKMLVLITYILGKISGFIALNVYYLYTAELLPTEFRTFGLGLASFPNSIGMVIAPYIHYATSCQQYVKIPLAILAGVLFLGSFTLLRLPETKDSPLSETIEEAEEFAKSRTIVDCVLSIFCCSNTNNRAE